MGVRDPGFRILTYEMSVSQRLVPLLGTDCRYSEEVAQGGAVPTRRAFLGDQQDSRKRFSE